MRTPIFHVDAFAERPFAGNPAAVCLLTEEQPADWMQSLAGEMNLSETAFVRRMGSDFNLRWFTPIVEVDLCGHATLASAHVLWSEGLLGRGEVIRFHTRSGVLTCTQAGDIIQLNFPSIPTTQSEPDAALLRALGVQPSFFGQAKFDKLVIVESEEIVRTLKPDFQALRDIPGIRGVIVSSKATDSRFDFISRFFAPGSGIDEDPVTGSAHCSLAPFWSERLGKLSMNGFQASRRGGAVAVRVEGDRVVLGGKAVTIVRGEVI